MRIRGLLIVFLFIPAIGFANGEVPIKNYGVRGHTFAIKENSLLEVIKKRLQAAQKSGEIKKLQHKFQARVKQKVANPLPVVGIAHTKNPRVFFYNPTYIQPNDVTDHLDKIVIKKGTTINPLDKISWGEPLIFIDGKDETQVEFAKKTKAKIVLVKGSPLALHKQHGMWFYFDQAGLLVEKLGIIQVPAIVRQVKNLLKIEEIKL